MRGVMEAVSLIGFFLTTVLNVLVTKRDKAHGMGRDLSPARAVITVLNAVFMLMAAYFIFSGLLRDAPSIS